MRRAAFGSLPSPERAPKPLEVEGSGSNGRSPVRDAGAALCRAASESRSAMIALRRAAPESRSAMIALRSAAPESRDAMVALRRATPKSRSAMIASRSATPESRNENQIARRRGCVGTSGGWRLGVVSCVRKCSRTLPFAT